MSDTLKKVLYVEDEADIQTVAKLALESVGGFEVMVCSSGAEALEKAPVFNPDIFLLDVMMPGMDGPDTLVALLKIEELSNTPAIFLTAKAMPAEVERYKSLGALDVIPKPFDPMTLADQVKDIWSRRNG
ncbi:MAG: response regulator [Rhodospirillales bacterium]|nr:response regulator [Alphaproteobacteria bacterium]MBL6948107.1 response regulator [Rhodospirillales bacterium]